MNTARDRVKIDLTQESMRTMQAGDMDIPENMMEKERPSCCSPTTYVDPKNTHSGSSVGGMVPIKGTPKL